MKTKINSRFSIERDRYGWILYEATAGVNPVTKEPTAGERRRYYTSLVSGLNAVIDISCDDCDTTTSLLQKIEAAHKDVMAALGSMGINVGAE